MIHGSMCAINKPTNDDIEITIALVGFKSSGKSMLINSIIGQKILPTGIYGATNDATYIGSTNRSNLPEEQFIEHNNISDDGIAFNIIDLPGIVARSGVFDLHRDEEINIDEQSDEQSDEQNLRWIVEADAILWVSDVNTTFQTTNEIKHFDHLCELLENEQLKAGKLIQIGIVITKCNENYLDVIENNLPNDYWDDDNSSPVDRIKKVIELYGGRYNVMLFNSFGRIKGNINYVNNGKFKHTDIVNTEFNIKWMIDDFFEKHQKILYRCAINHLERFSSENFSKIFPKIIDRKYVLDIVNRLLSDYPFDECIEILDMINIYRYDKISINELLIPESITGEILVKLSKILGLGNYEYKKIYFKNFERIGNYKYDDNNFIDLELSLTDNTPLHYLDQKLIENPHISSSKKFIGEVETERKMIYGEDLESDIDIRTVIMLFMNKRIHSVLQDMQNIKPTETNNALNKHILSRLVEFGIITDGEYKHYGDITEILCEYDHLKELPKEIGQLINLTSLELCDCFELKELPKEIGQLINLTSLKLHNCFGLKELPKEIGQLINLTSLYLPDCGKLEELPKEIGQLINLTSLDLSECGELEELPKEIGQLINLTSLDLSECGELEELPKEIGQLINLTSLNLSCCCELKELPKEIWQLINLTSLDLSYCCEELPKEIGQLINLTSLKLYNYGPLEELPKEIGQLINLTSLELCDCFELKELPKEIGQLINLTSLDLLGCSELKELPEEIGQLINLTSLKLCDCGPLEELLKEICQLINLTSLDLSHCFELKELPKEIGQLINLTSLNLSYCFELKELPKEIWQLINLTSLDLSDSRKLKELPKEIGQLINLTSLKLYNCGPLEELLKEIWQLINLTSLDLSDSRKLKELPKEIGQLINLTSLDLSDCHKLKELPKEIGQLINLTLLNLSRCSKLKELPKEIGQLINLSIRGHACAENDHHQKKYVN
jgi:Leucine-rich repeat (LRR) protein/GTPase SAR1 family protein